MQKVIYLKLKYHVL